MSDVHMVLSPRLHLVAAAALVALFLAQSFSASVQKSPTADEPAHIAAGLSYVDTHVFRANLQHPPLLKELSALSLWLGGIHWLDGEQASRLLSGDAEGEQLEWPLGNEIIAKDPARVMWWARLPFPLLGGLLGFLIYWWGRQLVGSAAAFAALFLYALDPTIVGHSFLVTTDVGLASFTVVFLYALWRYLQQPSWHRLALCGLAMGAVLCTKYSAAFLWPTTAVLLVAAVPAPPRTRFTLDWPRIATSAAALAGMSVIAVVVIEAVYLFPSDPLLYVTGATRVNADHVAGHLYYFNGELAKHFYSYFVAAYLLKEPLAAIIAMVVGLVIVLSGQALSRAVKLFLLLPPAVFFLANTFLADDIGVRYVIPALPFAYLLGGVALSTLFSRPELWSRAAASALCLWLVVEAVGIYPDHLSYFNEAACVLDAPDQIGMDGGSHCGSLWLDDSNVDWGQGVKQLRTWMEEHGEGRTLRLAYFGSFPPDKYGLAYERVDEKTLMSAPPPGLYAVSASWVARIAAAVRSVAPGASPWTDRVSPVAIVGHAFYIYDIH